MSSENNSIQWEGLAEIATTSSVNFYLDMDQREPDLLRLIRKAVITLSTNFSSLPTEITSGRQGGVLVIGRRGKNPIPPLVIMLGQDEGQDNDGYINKPTKHMAYALAKFAVLIQNPSFTDSYQNSTLPGGEKLNIGGEEIPAGAITLESGWSVGFSGLPTGGQDVYIAMLLSYMVGIATFKDLDKLGLLSDNGLWSEALDLLTTGK